MAEKKSDKLFRKIILAGCGIGLIFCIYDNIKDKYYIPKHLDKNAVIKNDCPLQFEKILNYEDRDDDGDYESYIWLMGSNKFRKTSIIKDAEGNIIFPEIDEKAVMPPNTPYLDKNGNGNPIIDYKDINKDGKLESIISLTNDKKEKMTYKVEVINGEYTFSKID